MDELYGPANPSSTLNLSSREKAYAFGSDVFREKSIGCLKEEMENNERENFRHMLLYISVLAKVYEPFPKKRK